MTNQDMDIIDAAAVKLGWITEEEVLNPYHCHIPMFHLECLRKEFPEDSASQLSLKVAERLGQVLDGPGKVKWYGDPMDNMPTAASILASLPILPPRHKIDEILDFYHGQQWNTELRRHRGDRPTLTMNMLPLLVAGALDSQRKAGLPELCDEDLEKLIVILASRNVDAQKMYNYMVSQVAEIMSMTTERFIVRKAE
jgi:hypothetical protein